MKNKKHRARRRSSRKRPSRRTGRSRTLVPRTTKQFFAMSKQSQDEWETITNVVSESRRTRKSPRKIAKGLGIDFKTVLSKARSAFRKQRNGRYKARPTDKLLRVVIIPNRKGLREIATRDSRQASLVARYWVALKRYLAFGDPSVLHEFDGKKITDASGKRVPLLTDLTELDRLGAAGELSFETIYAKR